MSLLNSLLTNPVKTLIVSNAYIETSKEFEKRFKTDQVMVVSTERLITTQYDYFNNFILPNAEQIKKTARLAKQYKSSMLKVSSDNNLHVVSKPLNGKVLRIPIIQTALKTWIPATGVESIIITSDFAREYYRNKVLNNYF